jgi:hypothetical protein
MLLAVIAITIGTLEETYGMRAVTDIARMRLIDIAATNVTRMFEDALGNSRQSWNVGCKRHAPTGRPRCHPGSRHRRRLVRPLHAGDRRVLPRPRYQDRQ